MGAWLRPSPFILFFMWEFGVDSDIFQGTQYRCKNPSRLRDTIGEVRADLPDIAETLLRKVSPNISPLHGCPEVSDIGQLIPSEVCGESHQTTFRRHIPDPPRHIRMTKWICISNRTWNRLSFVDSLPGHCGYFYLHLALSAVLAEESVCSQALARRAGTMVLATHWYNVDTPANMWAFRYLCQVKWADPSIRIGFGLPFLPTTNSCI